MVSDAKLFSTSSPQLFLEIWSHHRTTCPWPWLHRELLVGCAESLQEEGEQTQADNELSGYPVDNPGITDPLGLQCTQTTLFYSATVKSGTDALAL